MLTSSTQLQNRLFHVVERRRISAKREKMKMRFSSLNMQIYDVFCCRRRAWLLSSLTLAYDIGLESVAINCESLFQILWLFFSHIARNTKRSYVLFSLSFNVTSCWSYIGKVRVSGGQSISIGDRCDTVGTVLHELMHALGFFHTSSRYDRDSYVIVRYENIRKGKWLRFDVINWNQDASHDL